jgi:hypothetical protein
MKALWSLSGRARRESLVALAGRRPPRLNSISAVAYHLADAQTSDTPAAVLSLVTEIARAAPMLPRRPGWLNADVWSSIRARMSSGLGRVPIRHRAGWGVV